MSFNKSIACSMLVIFMLFTTCIAKGNNEALSSVDHAQKQLDDAQKQLDEVREQLGNLQSRLSDLDSQAKSLEPTKKAKSSRARKQYERAVAQADSEYKSAKKKLDKKYKDAGVNMFSALLPNKKQAIVFKPLNNESKEIAIAYKNAKAQAKEAYSLAVKKLQKDAKTQKIQIADERARLLKEKKKKETELKKAKGKQHKGSLRVIDEKKAKIFKSYEEGKAQEEGKPGVNEIKSVNAKLRQVDKQFKQEMEQIASKAKSLSMERAKRKARIEREYRADLISIEKQYKDSLKAIEKQKKAAGIDGFGGLFPDKKKRAAINAIKQDKAGIVAQYKIAKSEAKKKNETDLADIQKQADSDKKELKTGMKSAKIIRDTRKAELKQDLSDLRKQAKKPKAEQPTDKMAGDEEKRQMAQAKKRTEAKYKEAQKQAKTQKAEVKKKLSVQLKAIEKSIKADLESISSDKQGAKKQFEILQRTYKTESRKALTESGKSKAKRQLAEAQADYKASISELDSKKKQLRVNKSHEKVCLETDTKKALSLIDNEVEYARAISQLPGHKLADDATSRLTVSKLHINGNSLIATDKLLANLPLVYPAAEKDKETDESINVYYDFRVFHEIISDPGVERQVSQKTIQTLTKYLLSVYEEKKYAGIFVYVPKETVTEDGSGLENDILSIRVLEGKISDITVNKYDLDQNEVEKGYLRKSSILSWSPAKIGKVANKKQIDDYVRLLNQNPDRFVQPVISKSGVSDSLTLEYEVHEANPWHYFLQVDNSGVDEKHKWTPRVGFVNTNFTGNDDMFSFTYQAKPTSEEFMKDNYSAFGSYETPLFNPALRVGFFAGYSRFDISPGSGTNMNFRGNGTFYGNSLRYNFFQIDDGPLKNWMFDFVGTISHEESRVTPTLFVTFPEVEVEMNLLGLGIEAHHSDYAGMSKSYLSFTKTSSIGGGSTEEEFQSARDKADPDFSIYTFSASHRQYLDETKIHEFMGTFRYIKPDERLVPAKMTTFGGMYSVRGYEENEIVADGGVLASVQYRFDLSKHLINQVTSDDKERDMLYRKTEMWPPNLSLLVFSDYGRSKTKDPTSDEIAHETLMSVGVGVQAELGANLSAGVYYAMPLEDALITQAGDAGSWYFNFVYRW